MLLTRKTLPPALLAALVALGAGCGGSGTTTPSPPPVEYAQALPKLPAGWQARRSRSIGYAIGVPPGWQVTAGGGKVLFRSPDHLVAVTLSVDRNSDALELPLGTFATRALAALPGFEAQLTPSEPKPFGGTPLDAVQTTATGTTKSRGIEERATIVVLRRDAIVNYTVAIVENAKHGYSSLDRRVALLMVRTLRDQPVENPLPPESL